MKNKKNKNYFLRLAIILLIFIIPISFLAQPILKNLNLGLDLQGGFEIVYEISPLAEDTETPIAETTRRAYDAIEKRVNSLGVTEPKIEIIGSNQIQVQLAGVKDPEEARRVIQSPAELTFRDTFDNLLMNSDVIKSATTGVDQLGKPAVVLAINDTNKFYDVTLALSKQSNNQMVIWLDFIEGTDSYEAESKKSPPKYLSAANVSEGFSSNTVQITGNFTKEEVEQQASLINSGALPAKLTEISVQSVSASLGAGALASTATAGLVGIAVLGIFIIYFYRISGLLAVINLLIYTFFVFLGMYLIGATLTLPGIAAVIVGIGMAVDSNVITFERIKDELKMGRSLQDAFTFGNKQSFGTIVDANLTTLVVAVVLFIFGRSSVKGFALTLIISLIITMSVTIFVVRLFLKQLVKSNFFNKNVSLFIGLNDSQRALKYVSNKFPPNRFEKINFIKMKGIFYKISLGITVLGIASMLLFQFNLGIDFTSGTKITFEAPKSITEKDVSKGLNSIGIKVEEKNVTFSQSDANKQNNVVSLRSKNVLNEKQEKEFTSYVKTKFDSDTNISKVSPIVGKMLIRNAIYSLIIASILILIYVSLRFQKNFAIGGVIALFHDTFIIILLFSILRIEISSDFIAALLAIIGYSINDTIIIFDRIRENKKNMYPNGVPSIELLDEIYNISLQQTMTRSIITTLTTLIPIIAIIFIGANAIFPFSLALFFGVFAGSYSSIFIASQIALELEKRDFGKVKKSWLDDEVHEHKIKGLND